MASRVAAALALASAVPTGATSMLAKLMSYTDNTCGTLSSTMQYPADSCLQYGADYRKITCVGSKVKLEMFTDSACATAKVPAMMDEFTAGECHSGQKMKAECATMPALEPSTTHIIKSAKHTEKTCGTASAKAVSYSMQSKQCHPLAAYGFSRKNLCMDGKPMIVQYADLTCTKLEFISENSECRADDRGYFEQMSCVEKPAVYGTMEYYQGSATCSADKLLSTAVLMEACVNDADFDDATKTWTEKSLKMTMGATSMTQEEFSKADCTGTATSSRPSACAGSCTAAGANGLKFGCVGNTGPVPVSGGRHPGSAFAVLLAGVFVAAGMAK